MKSNLLTINEASSLLNIKESRVRTAVFKNEIPYIKIGRLIRFEKEAILHWIDSNTIIDTNKTGVNYEK